MNVGFYFHIPMSFAEGSARVPAHMGAFIDELGRRAGKVTFYGHSQAPSDAEDFVLNAPHISVVDLGPRRSAPHRTFTGRRLVDEIDFSADGVDVMLVRGPSPLLPWFGQVKQVPVAYYLQSDYRTVSAARWMPAWRRAAIELWKIVYTRRQTRALTGAHVIVNSPELARGLEGKARKVYEVVSSLVRAEDVVDVSARRQVRGFFHLAYAGRIVEEKGLLELCTAVAELRSRGVKTTAALYGRPDDEAFEGLLLKQIERLGAMSLVQLKGYLPLPEVRSRFREADCLVLPSYHEGFPHVVLDAMAAGLPVVATRVGGLPHYLRDGIDAILIEPRSVSAIVQAIELLAGDDDLRRRLALAGSDWVRQHTLERTCSAVIDILKSIRVRSKP